jgi:3-hydroxybenzoate 6-monooxygenase
VTAKSDPVLIVGGGLGGLAAALALGRAGWHVRVLEQAPEFGAIGYGIQLGPNVFHMFERLGVAASVREQSDFPPALLMLDSSDGEPIIRISTGASFRQRFTYPYIVVHRIDLHNVLLAACKALPTIELLPLTGAAAYEDLGDRVRLRTQDGRVIEGAALIGADGLRSVIRTQMLAESEPRMVGYVAHRTIVPMAKVPASVEREASVLWSGPGFHLVHYPLRHATLFNIVAVFRTATYAKGDFTTYRSEVQDTYRDAHPTMQALLGMMDLGRRWAISDRDPIRHWSRGRVTLLGDAAHPTLQSLAQGACMAIEDALTLADCIELAGGDCESAFWRYETARYVRTARVQLESRFMWDHFYHVGGIARDVMRQDYSARSEQELFSCLAWLYDGFALPADTNESGRRSMAG